MKNSTSLRLQHVSVTIALFVAVFAVSMTAAAANGLSMLDPASHVEARQVNSLPSWFLYRMQSRR